MPNEYTTYTMQPDGRWTIQVRRADNITVAYDRLRDVVTTGGGWTAMQGLQGWSYEYGRNGAIVATPTPDRERTPEEIAQRELQAQQEHERRVERERLRAAAREKAEETLRRMLSRKQLDDHTKSGFFYVKGSEGHRFRIWTDGGYSGNIDWMGKGQEVKGRYCCHPDMWGADLAGEREHVPAPDAFIAQKLMLEADEVGFMRTTVVNSGSIPKVATKHVDGPLPRSQHCRCTNCFSTYAW